MKLSRISLTGLISLFWFTAAAAAPEIAIDQSSYNFGSIHQGEKVEHLFIIKNKGDAPLTITGIRPSCGCTAASITTSVIASGKTGEIKAFFDSANFAGAIHKTLAVDTDDPKAPTFTLTLSGTVIEDIQIHPKQLNLGQVKVNETTKTTLIITNTGSKQLKLTSVKTSISQIVAVADKILLNPGESSKISLTISPRSGDRLLSGYLAITTDNPIKAGIIVPVYGSPIP